MEQLEQKLRAARLAEPSPDLDRRMENTFRSAAGEIQRQPRPTTRWWWLTAATTVGGLAAALLLMTSHRPRLPPAPAPVVYRIEAQGRMRDLLLGSTFDREERPHFDFRVHRP